MAMQVREYAKCGYCQKNFGNMIEPVELLCTYVYCLPCLLKESGTISYFNHHFTCPGCRGSHDLVAIVVLHLYEAIANKSKTVLLFGEHFSDEIIAEVIASEQPQPDNGENVDKGTALHFALDIRSYELADRMLYILINMGDGEQAMLLTFQNKAGNNALQAFLSHLRGRESLNSMDETEKSYVPPIWRQLLHLSGSLGERSYEELITNVNIAGESAISLAILCKPIDNFCILKHLTDKMVPSTVLKMLQPLLGCNCVKPDDQRLEDIEHKERCTEGYNLFMLALSRAVKVNIDTLISVFKKGKQFRTCLCKSQSGTCICIPQYLLGNKDPKRYVERPNSLRVAAVHDQINYVTEILSFIPKKQRPAASLEHDHRTGSVIGQIFKTGKVSSVRYLFRNAGSTFEGDFGKILEHNDWRSNFEELEATMDFIDYFHTKRIPQSRQFIPRSSIDKKRSRPEALIFYNTFNGTTGFQSISETEPAALKLEATLLDLGWEDDAVLLHKDKWTIEELKTKIQTHLSGQKRARRVSLMLLCITSHGTNGEIYGTPDEQGPSTTDINAIIKLMNDNLPERIPKVLIVDVCRRGEGKPIDIGKKDFLLLMGACIGSTARAGLYMNELATQIAFADGRMSLLEMHEKAKFQVEQHNDTQIPQCMSNADPIVLNRLIKSTKFLETLIYADFLEDGILKRQSIAVELRKNMLNLGWPMGVISIAGKYDSGSDIYEKPLLDALNQLDLQGQALVFALPGQDTTPTNSKRHSNEEGGSPESDSDHTAQIQVEVMTKIRQTIDDMASKFSAKQNVQLVILEVVKADVNSPASTLLRLNDENMLLLVGSRKENQRCAKLYLGRLTEQITNYEEKTLQEIHAEAVREVQFEDGESRVFPDTSSKWRKKSHKFTCAKCQDYIKPRSDFLACGRCPKIHHLNCTNVTVSDLATIRKVGVKWLCPSCCLK